MSSPQSIHTIDQLAQLCESQRAAGKTIGHCHGAFDLLHPGHVRHLQAARELCDVLVVTLTEDRFIRKGPGRPVFNERLRAETVQALAAVDYVGTSPWPTAVETIEKIRPDLYIKGQDYRHAANDLTEAILLEEKTVARHGGKLVFTDELQFSSTKLLNEFFSVLTDEQRTYLRKLKKNLNAADVLATLDRIKPLRILVVGEAIRDEYHYCLPDAMSNKSPTISVRFDTSEVFAGGVVAVANNLVGLCQSVTVLAGAGAQDHDPVSFVEQATHDAVQTRVVVRPDAPTVCKRRYVHRFSNQKLFEVTSLNDRPIPAETEDDLLRAIDELAPQADVTIVLDFGHGFFSKRIAEHLRKRSTFLAVNAQINSSNRGFNSIRKYVGADYLSVDEHEIRLPFGDRYGPLCDIIKALSKETGCSNINVTLGTNGTFFYDGDRYHHAPALTTSVIDALGAGDALLAATAPLVHLKASPEMITLVGNCMGGLATQIIGHREPVSAIDLYRFLNTLLK